MASVKLPKKSRKDSDEFTTFWDYFEDLSLSRINGEINKMTKAAMVQLLRKNGLNTKGVKEVLNRRLKNYYWKQRADCVDLSLRSQCYKHFIVIDFEATCEKRNGPEYIHEIIEFPAILMDAESGNIIDEFHSYCRPTLNSTLSEFCVSLTGICQSDVDKAPEFPDVLENFEEWLKERNLLTRRNAAFITDGPWDFSRFLNIQSAVSDISYPKWAKRWINLKKAYGNFYKINRPKLEVMLSNLGLKFKGRLHCGIDDAKNICKVVARLIDDGCVLQVNERLNAGRLESITEKERQKLSIVSRLDSDGHKSHDDHDSDKENAEQSIQTVEEEEVVHLAHKLSQSAL